MSSHTLVIDSPLVDVVDSVVDVSAINAEHENVIETGDESSDLLKLLSNYQGRFSLFRDGILKLKQYYDMQMLLMKSHLHGDEEDSIEVFFGKLIQIMELAVNKIFSLLDLSKLEEVDNYTDMDKRVIAQQRANQATLEVPMHHHLAENIPIASSASILSPQFDFSYTSHDDLTTHHDNKERFPNRYYPNDVLLPGSSSVMVTADSGDYLESGIEVGLTDDTCVFCKATFTTRRDLNRHMRTHTGEKPYQCGVCLKTFSRKDFLSKHKLTHTGEKPHICTLCSKNFSQRSNLNKHMRTHTKNHKYTCKLCQRGFHQLINLHRHEQLHCNTCKHFRCIWCIKMAYQGSDCMKTCLDKREADNELT